MSSTRLPNFFIIGAVKSGTSSLYHYLGQHPDIFMSPCKEPSYFAVTTAGVPMTEEDRAFNNFMTPFLPPDLVSDPETYKSLFDLVSTQEAVGEASTVYMISDRALRNLRRYAANARFFAMLRDPVEAAYSTFLMSKRTGHQRYETFDEALDESQFPPVDIQYTSIKDAPELHFLVYGFYNHWMTRYFDAFGRDRVRAYFFDDFSSDPMSILADVFSTLDVDTGFHPDTSIKHNVDRVAEASNPMIRLFERVVPADTRRTLRSMTPKRLRDQYERLRAPSSTEVCSPEARARLISYFKEDIMKLQDLLDRDLSHWLV